MKLIYTLVILLIIVCAGYFFYSSHNDMLKNSTLITSEQLPHIDAIYPSGGPVGTIVVLTGENLNGLEGDLDAWIENDARQIAYLPSYASVYPKTTQITVQINGKLCTKNNSYSGAPCDTYMTIVPGKYKIFTQPWGNKSNAVDFEVTK